MDMEAGIEHLGRGTAIGVDHLIIVTEPGFTSIETAVRIQKLARDIGITKISAVSNKVKDDNDRAYLKQHLKPFNFSGYIEYCDEIKKMNMSNASIFTITGKPIQQTEAIISNWR